MDLEPGTDTRARTGDVAAGAGQGTAGGPSRGAECSMDMSLVGQHAVTAHPPRGGARRVTKAAEPCLARGFLAMKRHILYIP